LILDTSALMAILRSEPERQAFALLIARAERRLVSAGTWVELAAVLSKDEDQDARMELYEICREFGIKISPVTEEQARIGHLAYLTYGKGHHQARLNFGDCFVYALAKETGLPLLFKGDDFSQTDVVAAV
jgi:ribonuclease VapC